MANPAVDGTSAKLAEIALRNLRLDGLAGPDESRFSSRALRFGFDGLIIDAPTHCDQPVVLTPGDSVVCFCQLGRDVLRFTAEVIGPASCQRDNGDVAAGVILAELTEPTVAQHRQHQRISLEGSEPVGAVIWLMDVDESGQASVVEEISGQVSDISTGGICMTMSHVMWIPFVSESQLWIRIMLPAESESLLFRAKPQHVGEPDENGLHRVGLQFTEAVEPGQHQLITQQLANFLARREPPAARAG